MTDAYGRSTNTTAALRIRQSVPSVTAAIVGAPTLTFVAGATVTLDGASSTCLVGNCSYAWLLHCGARAPLARVGRTTTVTTGPGSAVNTMGASLGVKCSVLLTVTDGTGATGTAGADLTVRTRGGLCVQGHSVWLLGCESPPCACLQECCGHVGPRRWGQALSASPGPPRRPAASPRATGAACAPRVRRRHRAVRDEPRSGQRRARLHRQSGERAVSARRKGRRLPGR